jgi:hypothetical protein
MQTRDVAQIGEEASALAEVYRLLIQKMLERKTVRSSAAAEQHQPEGGESVSAQNQKEALEKES